MPELSKDLVTLLQYLAPGFVVAWVFFSLTAYNKPSQFERVVQALIFTVVIQLLVKFEIAVALWLGQKWDFGTWTSTSSLAASLVTALAVGVLLSVGSHGDMHSLLRKLGLSSRSSYPCEWFGIFKEYQRFVVLHLKDGTRIFGWPKVWPSEPQNGHFFITFAHRTAADGEQQDLPHLEGILIDAKDVSWVEFAVNSN
jgi:hypothetical protein